MRALTGVWSVLTSRFSVAMAQPRRATSQPDSSSVLPERHREHGANDGTEGRHRGLERISFRDA